MAGHSSGSWWGVGLALGVAAWGMAGCTPQGWRPVLVDAPEGALLSVWGAAADDVWVVGGQPEAGVVLRGAEDTWTPLALPVGTPLLNWVHGSGPEDVWVAGLAGTLLHWDGAAWEDHSEPMDEAFWGVYARSPVEAWAVGGASRWGGAAAVLRVWDGDAWSPVELPPEAADLPNLFKVTYDGAAPWAVGSSGVALRGDATGFSAVATSYGGDLVTAQHSDIGGPLLVVGGRGTGEVLVGDGERLTPAADAPAGLNGVWLYGDVAVVVGESGLTGVFDLATEQLTVAPVITADVLHATWGTPGGTMYAVGGNLATSDPTFHGVLLRSQAPEAAQ